MFNIFNRRRVSKAEKVLMAIYQDLYKNSTPKANFKKLVKEANINERGQKVIPFNDYEIDANLYDLIVETHIVKANLLPYDEKGVRLQAYLGCGPRSVS